jgi:hypothetical protein
MIARAEPRACGREVVVVLAEMHAGGADGGGEFDVVVDERHGEARAQRLQARASSRRQCVARLVAVLQNARRLRARGAGFDEIPRGPSLIA